MRRGTFALVGLLALAMAPAPGRGQVTDFCPLLEALIFADDGIILGRITPDTNAVDSLVNPFGDHGSEFSQVSIFNPIGAYGGMFALQSPYNPTTFFPPRIVVDGSAAARLTVNTQFSPRVHPDSLVSWLRTDEPNRCGEPTPTATMAADQPTATPAAVTATPSGAPTATALVSPTAGTPATPPPATPTAVAPPGTPRSPTVPPTVIPPFQRTQLNRSGARMCAIADPATSSTAAPLLLLPAAFLARSLARRRRSS